MKLQLMSDLHLEFAAFEASCTHADVLILAGDIDVGTQGIDWAMSLDLDIPVIYVAGNHEYYYHGYPSLLESLRKRCENSKIHFLENEHITLDGVRFHGATLWTDFRLFGSDWATEAMAQYSMPDYRVIRQDTEADTFAPAHSKMIHAKSLEWLAQSLEASGDTTNIVVTHHAPSLRSSAGRFKDDKMTAAFISDLEDFIDVHKPDLWCHGHCHNFSDYMIGQSRVVCNPRGYPKEADNAFKPELIIEV